MNHKNKTIWIVCSTTSFIFGFLGYLCGSFHAQLGQTNEAYERALVGLGNDLAILVSGDLRHSKQVADGDSSHQIDFFMAKWEAGDSRQRFFACVLLRKIREQKLSETTSFLPKEANEISQDPEIVAAEQVRLAFLTDRVPVICKQ